MTRRQHQDRSGWRECCQCSAAYLLSFCEAHVVERKRLRFPYFLHVRGAHVVAVHVVLRLLYLKKACSAYLVGESGTAG